MKLTRKLIVNAFIGMLSIATLSGCQSAPKPVTSTNVWQRTELYFGRATNTGGVVSDTEWNNFVNREIASRFPQGSTVVDAHGQWADPTGSLVSEDSRVLILFHCDSPDIDHKIETLRKLNVAQFSQEAVMRVDSSARVRF